MKVILTGDATADHFYPLIAVAEELNTIIDNENLADTQLYYMAEKPYNTKALYENGIRFKLAVSGKSRFSPVSIIGAFQALFQVFSIFPDVVFSTGGAVAYPALWAARVLRIPVIIHESNSIPNNINKWSAVFAKSITVAYKEAIDFFDKDKLIHLGQPIRHNLQEPSLTGAYEFLNLEHDTPILWVIGGTSGAENINQIIENALPELLKNYQVIHQTGKSDYDNMKMITDATLINHGFKYRYHAFDYLNQLSMKMVAGVADIAISRAGSTLFELAHWEIPSIIVPISKSYGNHQIKNAYNYARSGACIVIEENNFSEQGLLFEINRIYNSEKDKSDMVAGAKKFAIKDAGRNIAEEIVGIALAHDK